MKKLLTLFLALCFTSVSLSAQESGAAKLTAADSVLYSTTFYFEKNQGEWIEKYEYANAGRLLKWAEANSSALINIKGWTDPSGAEEFNTNLSLKRANTIHNYLVGKGVNSSRITIEGKGVDSQTDNTKARRADVVAYIRVANKEVVAEIEAETEIEAEKATATETGLRPIETQQDSARLSNSQKDSERLTNSQQEQETCQAQEPTPIQSKKCFEWNYFTPRVNLLYWVGGMMNLGVEYKSPESDFGFLVNGGYSPFGNTEWNHNLGGWFVAPEVRYYLPSNEQWFVGAQFLAAGYNYKLSETGYQGSVIGGGIMGGYCITLSETFDMDFTLGLGYGHLEYDTYYHDEPTNTNPYITKGETKNSLIPIQAGVNLIWKIK